MVTLVDSSRFHWVLCAASTLGKTPYRTLPHQRRCHRSWYLSSSSRRRPWLSYASELGLSLCSSIVVCLCERFVVVVVHTGMCRWKGYRRGRPHLYTSLINCRRCRSLLYSLLLYCHSGRPHLNTLVKSLSSWSSTLACLIVRLSSWLLSLVYLNQTLLSCLSTVACLDENVIVIVVHTRAFHI